MGGRHAQGGRCKRPATAGPSRRGGRRRRPARAAGLVAPGSRRCQTVPPFPRGAGRSPGQPRWPSPPRGEGSELGGPVRPPPLSAGPAGDRGPPAAVQGPLLGTSRGPPDTGRSFQHETKTIKKEAKQKGRLGGNTVREESKIKIYKS